MYVDVGPASGASDGGAHVTDIGDDLSGDITDDIGDETELVIVTGLSGAGRSTVARALENIGYYVVDNLPQPLMIPMAELARDSALAYAAGEAGDDTDHGARRTAIVLDVRSRSFSRAPLASIEELRTRGFAPHIVFVDASDDVLIRRFESVRRLHPMPGGHRLADGIAAERRLLADVRSKADLVLDTTILNVNQLRARVEELFASELRSVGVTVLSFGFKYGLPLDADLVVDMRFLPNPHWVPELRKLTGCHEPVSSYVLKQPGATEFLDRYATLVADMLPGYRREGKQRVTVAVGCTGGKHRSVAITIALAERLREAGVVAEATHRDLGRE